MKQTCLLALSLLALLPCAALAAPEEGVKQWLRAHAPNILSNDPLHYEALMTAKRAYFTDIGFNGYKIGIETNGDAGRTISLVALCLPAIRMAEGGTWIVDALIVFKKPQNAIEASAEDNDPSAPPKHKPNPYYYQEGQFYIQDAATPQGLKINQYLAKQGPATGFTDCRADGELAELTGAIDEQLAFYEKTLAMLQERIAALHEQKQAITGAPAMQAPMSIDPTPPALQAAPAQAEPPPAAPSDTPIIIAPENPSGTVQQGTTMSQQPGWQDEER